MNSERRQTHSANRAALIASIVGAVTSALMAVTLPRFTDENYAVTTLVELAAPVLYLACVMAVFGIMQGVLNLVFKGMR